MAYLDTLDDEERQRAEVGGSAPAGSAPSGGPASSAPAPSSGFANLANYFAANREAASAQGDAAATALEDKANAALRSDSPGQAMSTLGEINAAATPGGLAAVSNRGDDPGYTAGMSRLDAYLGTRGADPGRFEGLRAHFGERLGRVEAPVAAPGERPDAPTRPEQGRYQSDREYADALSAYNRQIGEYQTAADAYAPGAQQYEEWAQRRAANIGDPYAPTYTQPDAAPAAARTAQIRELLNPLAYDRETETLSDQTDEATRRSIFGRRGR